MGKRRRVHVREKPSEDNGQTRGDLVKAIEADRAERGRKCIQEVDALLMKYGCEITLKPEFVPGPSGTWLITGRPGIVPK